MPAKSKKQQMAAGGETWRTLEVIVARRVTTDGEVDE
jgi:hypothetical protein